MKQFTGYHRLQLGVLLTLATILTACSGSGDRFPQVNSPPPFDYADGTELRSGMHQLAFASQRLDSALLLDNQRDEGTRLAVVASLRDIERIASGLEQSDLSTTHNFLRNDMQNFQSIVSRAIRDAERNPPNFSTAGRVSGSCVSCHRTVQ